MYDEIDDQVSYLPQSAECEPRAKSIPDPRSIVHPFSVDCRACFASAARKQVRVSLDSVLDVSTGERPWRSSFATANPDISAGPEPDFGRRACHSYVSDAERRKMTEGQLQSAQYLHRELPVRLAHAVTALDKVRRRVVLCPPRAGVVICRVVARNDVRGAEAAPKVGPRRWVCDASSVTAVLPACW